MSELLIYAASIVITIWGVAHIIATKSVVAGFGAVSPDNRRIITMEWIGEGLALCFIGVLVALVTILDEPTTQATFTVYLASAVMLLVMAGLTATTGARTSILPMKLCPWVKTAAAVLIIVAISL
ncbi:MAG: hypothetical protein V1894_03330 [Chloroflexota bacterium]